MSSDGAPQIPETMRAVVTPQWGGPDEGLVLRDDVAVPRPGPTEVLVKVHAAGVNPVDWKSRASGSFQLWSDPVILGWDVSGTVVAVGQGASLYEVGDEVFGMPWFPRQAGAYAEYVAAPSRMFAPKPPALSHVEAAGLPLVGLTVWQSLAEVAKVQSGQRVLILAAGGGVGHVAVQVAKALGASEVLGTASSGKHDWLRSLGADTLIDYREKDVAEVVSGVDVVLDAVGGDESAAAIACIRDGGTMVSLPSSSPLPDAAAEEARERSIRTGQTLVEPDRRGLLELSQLVADSKLRVEIAATFPLGEVSDAHRMGEDGHTAGKIVLDTV